MKTRKPAGIHRPFELLPDLLKGRSIRHDTAAPPPPRPEPPRQPLSEEEEFARAMSEVRRIHWDLPAAERPTPRAAAVGAEDSCLGRLRRLIECGAGFRVADTPEYVEGVGPHAPPGITRRLHRGDFAVQGHLDLHGLTVAEAHEAFDAFIRQSIARGSGAVLVIHGRGLSSPAEPVLKSKVIEWLSCGPWRKWVVAFTSARMCDGGPGASYVLLRRRPLSRRFRKRRPRIVAPAGAANARSPMRASTPAPPRAREPAAKKG